jgi:hypothetical protein
MLQLGERSQGARALQHPRIPELRMPGGSRRHKWLAARLASPQTVVRALASPEKAELLDEVQPFSAKQRGCSALGALAGRAALARHPCTQGLRMLGALRRHKRSFARLLRQKGLNFSTKSNPFRQSNVDAATWRALAGRTGPATSTHPGAADAGRLASAQMAGRAPCVATNGRSRACVARKG